MPIEYREVRVSNHDIDKILQMLVETFPTPDQAFVALVYALKLLRDKQSPEFSDEELLLTLAFVLETSHEEEALH